MDTFNLRRYALCVAIGFAAAVLTACSGPQQSFASPATRLVKSPITSKVGADVASWMLPEAKRQSLLYISNVYTVTVYSYPKGKHVGTLKNFGRPEGECTDSAGDVFIANGNTVVEYVHGGTKPINSFSLSGYAAASCAADPLSGSLAITWSIGFSKSYVAIYPHASGTPTLYDYNNMVFSFCGYDNKGNLLVDGQFGDRSANFALAELPNGGNNLEGITVNQTFEHAGAVQWDGKYIAVGDDEAQAIYRFAIKGSEGSLKGTVNLEGAQSVYQWWIDGKNVVGSDDLPNTVWYWNYPSGGEPIKSITKGVFHPIGAAISRP